MNWKELLWPWATIRRQREQIRALESALARKKQPRDKRGRFIRV